MPTLFGLATVVTLLPVGLEGEQSKQLPYQHQTYTPQHFLAQQNVWNDKKGDKATVAIIAPFWSPGPDLLTRGLASLQHRNFAINLQEIRFHFSPKVTNGQKHLPWESAGKSRAENHSRPPTQPHNSLSVKEIQFCFHSAPRNLPLPHNCTDGSDVRPHPHQDKQLLLQVGRATKIYLSGVSMITTVLFSERERKDIYNTKMRAAVFKCCTGITL